MKKTVLVVLSVFLLASSCEKEQVYAYSIDPKLEVYVDRFYDEAMKRGISISKSNLIVEFTSETTNDFCGECLKAKDFNKGQRRVKIVNTSSCWSSKLDQSKETLVFHELGHCLLDREHFDELFPDASPKSIMTTYEQNPYSPCIYVFEENSPSDCNKVNRRAFYIDELFGKSNTPFWLN